MLRTLKNSISSVYLWERASISERETGHKIIIPYSPLMLICQVPCTYCLKHKDPAQLATPFLYHCGDVQHSLLDKMTQMQHPRCLVELEADQNYSHSTEFRYILHRLAFINLQRHSESPCCIFNFSIMFRHLNSIFHGKHEKITFRY